MKQHRRRNSRLKLMNLFLTHKLRFLLVNPNAHDWFCSQKLPDPKCKKVRWDKFISVHRWGHRCQRASRTGPLKNSPHTLIKEKAQERGSSLIQNCSERQNENQECMVCSNPGSGQDDWLCRHQQGQVHKAMFWRKPTERRARVRRETRDSTLEQKRNTSIGQWKNRHRYQAKRIRGRGGASCMWQPEGWGLSSEVGLVV